MTSNSPAATTSKGMYWTGWVLSVLPVPLLLMSAMSKIQLSEDVVKGFHDLDWPLNTATALAVVEVGCLFLYLIPQTAVLGAILLTGYLGGACATHVRVADYAHFWVPIAIGVVVWLGLFFRDARVRDLAPLRRL